MKQQRARSFAAVLNDNAVYMPMYNVRCSSPQRKHAIMHAKSTTMQVVLGTLVRDSGSFLMPCQAISKHLGCFQDLSGVQQANAAQRMSHKQSPRQDEPSLPSLPSLPASQDEKKTPPLLFLPSFHLNLPTVFVLAVAPVLPAALARCRHERKAFEVSREASRCV